MRIRNWLKGIGVLRPNVFISYRRTDSGGYAGQLFSSLSDYYGAGFGFLDHKAIAGGDDFEVALDKALGEAEVVLAVIGPDWLTVESAGLRRLDDPDDWVRREVSQSLSRRDVRVMPVLVGGAQRPESDDLPIDLRPMLKGQAREVRSDRFEDDVKHLIRSIGGWRARWLGVPIYAWTAGVIALAIVIGLIVTNDENLPPTVPGPGSVAVEEGGIVEIDLLAGATDERVETLTLVADEFSASGGRVEPLSDGTVTYAPPRDFSGLDQFNYQVADDKGQQAVVTVFITVTLGPMRGDFNVAVGEFVELDSNGKAKVSARSTELSRTVSDRIDRDLAGLNDAEGFNFQVRHPVDTGPIGGDSDLERAEAASNLAAAIQADVVIYGVLTEDGFAPEFYLQPRGGNLKDAEELAGQYDLGSKILGSDLDTGSITGNATLRAELAARTGALVQFVVGLSWYGDRRFDLAETAFGQADVPEWRDEDGKEILHLFIGSAAGNSDDLPGAAAAYDRALGLNDQYARALIGQATVRFLMSKADCETGNPDEEGLRAAAEGYKSALTATDQPAISNVDLKAAFGLARIYVCLSQALVEDRWADAQAEFEKVVREFESGNESIVSLAIESYAGLALISLPFEGDPDPGPDFCAALALYDSAAALSDDPEQIASFEANRTFAQTKLGELDFTCPE